MAEVSSVALFTGHIEHVLAFYRAVGLQLHEEDHRGGPRPSVHGEDSG